MTSDDLNRRSQVNTEYPSCPVIAVGAVVFRNDRVLLVMRGKPPSENQWAIPGGSVKLGETLHEAAEREIFEETGITIKAGEPLFVFDAVIKDDYGRIKYHYVIVDLSAEYIAGEPVAGDDAKRAGWISAKEFKSLNISSATRKFLKTHFRFGE